MSDTEECSACGNPVDCDGVSPMDTQWCTFICEECHGCEACDGAC